MNLQGLRDYGPIYKPVIWLEARYKNSLTNSVHTIALIFKDLFIDFWWSFWSVPLVKRIKIARDAKGTWWGSPGLSLCQYHGWHLTGLQAPLDSGGIQKLEPTGSEKDLSVGTTEITALGMQPSKPETWSTQVTQAPVVHALRCSATLLIHRVTPRTPWVGATFASVFKQCVNWSLFWKTCPHIVT